MNYIVNECLNCGNCLLDNTCKKCLDNQKIKAFKNEPICLDFIKVENTLSLHVTKLKDIFKSDLNNSVIKEIEQEQNGA